MDGTTCLPTRDEVTLRLQCSICNDTEGEPVGVAGPKENLDAVVVIRCANCAAIYLSPDRGRRNDAVDASISQVPSRWLRRQARGLAKNPRILCVDCMPTDKRRTLLRRTSWPRRVQQTAAKYLAEEPVDGTRDLAPMFDLVLLYHSVESTRNPRALLVRVEARLRTGGRAVIVGANVRSFCFGLFGSRHWSGYDIPGGVRYLHDQSVRQLTSGTGLKVRSVSTLPAGEQWVDSLRNTLRDWGMRERFVAIATDNWLVQRFFSWIVEAFAVACGKGARFVTVLEKA